MTAEDWIPLTSRDDWDAAMEGAGFIVIGDVANDRAEGGPKFHHPNCPTVTLEHFEQKVLRTDGRPPNGRYWLAPTLEAACAGGARACRHPSDPLAQAAQGQARKGSQRAMQAYVNGHVDDLDAALRRKIPELAGAALDWRSPRAADGFAEYRDRAFLDAVGLGRLHAAMKRFWPTGGPRWDALAVSGDGEVLLVEAKSHRPELEGGGCKASPASREAIERALAWTQEALGVRRPPPEPWTGPLYQHANRLAFLVWLRSQGVQAWFAHVLFTDDPIGPTTAAQWEEAMASVSRRLGLGDRAVDHATHVILPAPG